MRYFIIDPIDSPNSGITKYSQLLYGLLSIQEEIQPEIIGINGRTIKEFRYYLKEYFSKFSNNHFIIEVPEAYASSVLIPSHFIVHVRLHLSHTLGQYLQNKNYDSVLFEDEKRVISTADFVSSPSLSCTDYTKFFFDIDRPFLLHPNPLIFIDNDFLKVDKKGKITVGFVGRWELLKGINYLIDLIEKNPKTDFIVCTTAQDLIPKRKNISYTKSAKSVYINSDILIVPSIYETASMVAIEAVAYGCKVIIWDHIGIGELRLNSLYKVPAFNLNHLDWCMHRASNKKTNVSEFNKIYESVSLHIVQNIKSIISNKPDFEINHQLYRKPSTLDIDLIKKEFNKVAANSSFDRKLRKLKRDPYLFFKDMYLKKTGKTYVNNITEKASVTQTSLGAADKNNKSAKRRAKLFCKLDGDIPISFHDYGEKFNDMRVVSIFNLDFYKKYIYKDILENIYSHTDFWPLRRENMGRGYISQNVLNKYSTTSSVFDNCILQQRAKLENIKDIFLFDIVDEPFISLFTHSNSTNRVHLVITNDSLEIGEDILEKIDSLIIINSHKNVEKIDHRYIRKLYSFINISDLHHYIRKVVQEGLAKPFDILIPIYNGYQRNLKIEELSKKEDLDIVVKIAKDNNFYSSITNICSANDYYKYLADGAEYIYARESIYFKYKTLCDDIVSKEDSLYFLKFAYADGAYIHVE